MVENNFTLLHISELKKCSVEDFCKLAKQKGISIPVDPDYLLSSSKLNAIDPELASNLKYGRFITRKKVNNDENPKDEVSIIPPELFRPHEISTEPQKNKWWSVDPTWIRTSDSLGARTQDPILNRDVLYLLS